MELYEVYKQILLEIKNNIKYSTNDDIDFKLQMDDDIFDIGQISTPATKMKPNDNSVRVGLVPTHNAVVEAGIVPTQDTDAQKVLSPPATKQAPFQEGEVSDSVVNQGTLTKPAKLQSSKSELPKDSRLYKINRAVESCKKCSLYKTRNNTVFGAGNLDADIMFIGEGPGANEDLTGLPFVGKAGDLLIKIIENVIKLKREDVYMANIVKCRPPGNRNPNNLEVSACIGYLHNQIKIINPKIIVPLGTVALSTLLPQHRSIVKSRGRDMILALSKENIYDVIPTYHPSYLLRGDQAEINRKKREVWTDIKKIMLKLNLPL